MRALLWITAAASILYGSYWGFGASALRKNVEQALQSMKAAGLADYSDLSLTGFPSRFDLTLTDPSLRTPDGRAAWQAPFLQVFALSYRPNEIIAVWPHEQTLMLWPETITISSADMRASAAFSASTALALNRSSLVGKELALASDAGWALALTELRLATRLTEGEALSHDLGIELLDIAPSAPLRLLIDPEGLLPETAERLHIDAAFAFDSPPALNASARARVIGITLREASLIWGEAEVEAKGSLAPDAQGFAEGQITLRFDNWRKLLAVLASSGVIPPEIAPTYETLLTQMQVADAPPDTAELPVTFSGGRILVGLIPIGLAPRL